MLRQAVTLTRPARLRRNLAVFTRQQLLSCEIVWTHARLVTSMRVTEITMSNARLAL